MKISIQAILITVCICVLAISANQLFTYFKADKKAEEGFSSLLPEELAGADAIVATPEDDGFTFEELLPYYKKLLEENEDFVGWIRIPGTRVSYPVMQTFDSPEFYLDRDFEKQYSASGTIFANSINNVNLPSDVVTLYGHRMKTGAMFGSLGDFLNEDFLLEHDTIVFDTLGGGRKEYKVYTVFSMSVSENDRFAYYRYSMFPDEEAFNEFMDRVQEIQSVSNPVNRPSFGEPILLLSTCEYSHEDGRLVIVATLK